jgi:lysine 2,3-aminomutase
MPVLASKSEYENDWRSILSQSITRPEGIAAQIKDNKSAHGNLAKVIAEYPMRINPYYLNLIKKRGDPIYRQAIPDPREISLREGYEDPLNEEGLSPVPGLTHKYPDRVLLLVSNQCPVYCRFCNRKRLVGKPAIISQDTIQEGINYIRANKQIRDVLLSGGDPLLLSNEELKSILSRIRSITHVEIIRIGTRAPCTLPQRVTPNLVEILKMFHPLYINTHFNHPAEITPQSSLACRRLAEAGIPLGCQTVLLKGVNDRSGIILELMRKLLEIRVRPYYLFQADLVKGTSHFWTPITRGVEIIKSLQGYLSGLGIPKFMIDLPQGGGKIPVSPDYFSGKTKGDYVIRNYKGQEYRYPILEK